MRVLTLELLTGARAAQGLAVAIDVLRASSHIVTLLARGARGVVPVETVSTARLLKAEHPDWILAGERGGLPPDGFELGNSPWEAARRDVSGRTIILTTSAGSKGLVAAARGANEVVVGCFLNAAAVVRHVRSQGPDTVSLLALGVGGREPSPEDGGAAELIAARLEGREIDASPIFERIRRHPEGQKFLDPTNRNYRVEDLEACLQLDTLDVVPQLAGGMLVATAPGAVGQ